MPRVLYYLVRNRATHAKGDTLMWYKIALAGAAGLLEGYYSNYCSTAEAWIIRNDTKKPETGSKELTLLNLNINHEIWRGGMRRKRFEYVLYLIGEVRPVPDIITFQEVYHSTIPLVRSVLGDSVLELAEYFKEYNSAFGHSSGVWHLGFELGKLTLSKYPIMDAAKFQLNGSYIRSILRTKIDTPGGVPTHVYNVHTTGLQPQLREVIAYVGSTAKQHERVIIAGDLNMDISIGSAGRTLLEQEGFVVSDVGPTALFGMSLKRAKYWRSIDCIAVRDQNPSLVLSFERTVDTYAPDSRIWPSDHAGIRVHLSYPPAS